MRVVNKLPHEIRVVETAWIPMSDGTKLAATIWLPRNAETEPVPAVLEMIPYRRRDGTARTDSYSQPYVAGHGYACVRVDIRGTGDSEGRIDDEYSTAELSDGVEIIAWISRQNWCSGSVGMWGTSWGGFNSLQVAALQPPALKAIITIYSTDDRYADDCHYMGGCLIHDNMRWGSQFFSHCTRPPDPVVVGDRWRQVWLDRLETMPLPVERWLSHQRRDSYWKHGSVCEDYSTIRCAVYAVGGWVDGYTNAVPRLLNGLSCPRKGLIGPWSHARPHLAKPGPAIGFLQEAVRWWDYWLKGIDNGTMNEPMLRVWMLESVPPATQYDVWPGRWVAEPVWPPSDIERVRFALNPERIDENAGAETALALRCPQTVGGCAGEWNPHGDGPNLPDDQRPDEGLSLCFDSVPLAEGKEILGAPVVTIDLASDRPNAFVAIRLSDVAPTGESTRITYGLLNLTHRNSHEFPEQLEPGQRYRVRVQLNEIGYSIPAGHRLRLAVSTSYWLLAWPSPEAVTLTVFAGPSNLEIPFRRPRPDIDTRLRPFGEPEGAPEALHIVYRRPEPNHVIQRDFGRREYRMTSSFDGGSFKLTDVDILYDYSGQMTYTISDDNPLSASLDFRQTQRLERDDWKIRTETKLNLTSTRDSFLLTASVDAFEGLVRVFTRYWDCRIPRDFV